MLPRNNGTIITQCQQLSSRKCLLSQALAEIVNKD